MCIRDRNKGKGNKDRFVLVPPILIDLLRDYYKKDVYKRQTQPLPASVANHKRIESRESNTIRKSISFQSVTFITHNHLF